MKVAIYCRLSEEDENKLIETDDSISIQNQKSMLISFALEKGWDIYNIYSDDDYKGADRNRPAFKLLLEDAKKKKFDIVLCKSQARFTREIELVEKIIHGDFLEWGIRFVGYADNADTEVRGNKKARQINGLVNEWYLEDLSDNIKSVLTDHKKKGMHIGSFALYGYQKDPKQKGHLIIDPEAAEVVRMVFDLFVSGHGKTNIARILNDKGIVNPTEYKKQKGLRYRGNGKKYGDLWKYYAISYMLTNEMYIGNMVQGKYENISYKTGKSRPVPKERWIRVEGTHEPIISREIWDRAQELINKRAKPMCNGELGVFANKTRCMYCGYTLRSCKNREFRYLKCPTHCVNKAACVGTHISQRFLERAIIQELNQIIADYLDENSAENTFSIQNSYMERIERMDRELKKLKKKAGEYQKALENSYIDKTKGLISESEFLIFRKNFNKEKRQYEEQILYKESELLMTQEAVLKTKDKRSILEKYRNIEQLDRNIMDVLIDYIEIGRNDNKQHKDDLPPIIIHWKF